jgi:DNA-binding MarR family transcriptional regulator
VDTSAQELQATAGEIEALTRLLLKSVKQDLERRLGAHDIPVSGLAYRMMRLLHSESPTLAEVSRSLAISPSALVPVVDTLEKRGYLIRGRDPNDRRRTPLTITEAGEGVLASVPAIDAGDSLVRGLETLGAEKRENLLTLLGELVAQVSVGLGDAPSFASRTLEDGGPKDS